MFLPKPFSSSSSILQSLTNSTHQSNPTRLEPGSSPVGLTEDMACLAFEKHGPNILATEGAPRTVTLLFTALARPFNSIIVALAIVSILRGDKETFTVMVIAFTSLRSAGLFHCCCGQGTKA